jgi:methyltransferase (TIGR00027 family)
MSDEGGLRNISDTANWVAVYRALESERPDALFRDPFARRLAGERGARIARDAEFAQRASWSFVARTVLFDRFISDAVASGADMVVNLAAGLDARPYRMDLPSNLQWIEVDLPDILAYKADQLAGETPRCRLERVPVDLSNGAARRELFERLNARAKSVMIFSEGLVVYLAPDEVVALATDLARPTRFNRWALDMVSPALMRMMQKTAMAQELAQAGAPFKFAPLEGPAFFERAGWKPVEIGSLLHSAAKLRRLPWRMRLIALLPDGKGRVPKNPWGGVCLFEKIPSEGTSASR